MTNAAEESDEALAERFRSIRLFDFAYSLGFELVAFDSRAGTARSRFSPGREFLNGFGSVHGGVVTAMLDIAGAVAGIGQSRLRASFPTIELKTSFLQPVPPGPVDATGAVIRLGKSIAFLESRIVDANGRPLATCTITARVVPFVAGEGEAK